MKNAGNRCLRNYALKYYFEILDFTFVEIVGDIAKQENGDNGGFGKEN